MTRQNWILPSVLAAIVACVALSPEAFAQETGRVEASGMVGLVSGIGTHSVVGGSVAAAVRNRILVIGELSYIPLGSDSVDILGVSSDFSARAISFNIGGQYQLRGAGKTTPYVGAGVGFLHSSSSSSVTTSFQGFNFTDGSSDTNAYFSVGGGARYYVNERWGLRPELMIFAGHQTFARASVGVFYRFGQ
jgi:Outer membrane protein beta-barrel domain